MTKQREFLDKHVKEKKIKLIEDDIEKLKYEIEQKEKVLDNLRKGK